MKIDILVERAHEEAEIGLTSLAESKILQKKAEELKKVGNKYLYPILSDLEDRKVENGIGSAVLIAQSRSQLNVEALIKALKKRKISDRVIENILEEAKEEKDYEYIRFYPA